MSNENKKTQFDGLNSFNNFLDHQIKRLDHQIKRMDDMLKIKEIYSVGKFYRDEQGNKLFCFFNDLNRILFVKEYSCSVIEILSKDINNYIMIEFNNSEYDIIKRFRQNNIIIDWFDYFSGINDIVVECGENVEYWNNYFLKNDQYFSDEFVYIKIKKEKINYESKKNL